MQEREMGFLGFQQSYGKTQNGIVSLQLLRLCPAEGIRMHSSLAYPVDPPCMLGRLGSGLPQVKLEFPCRSAFLRHTGPAAEGAARRQVAVRSTVSVLTPETSGIGPRSHLCPDSGLTGP